jgi:cation diffusion facilitator family transporter
VAEAVERLYEPPEVKHDRLFIISVLGFIVNLVGIFAFQHGGSHHGHSHSSSSNSLNVSSSGHSHDNEFSLLIANNHTYHGHSHGHSHGHTHDDINSSRHEDAPKSKIMQGVFLHILADTLGSVGVIVAAILMNQFGWMIADPICSIFIAALVSLSVLPLIRDSGYILMQRTPKEIEQSLPSCLQRVSTH